MAPFASPAWVEELDRALTGVRFPDGELPEPVVVQYAVTDPPEGTGPYALLLGPDGVRAVAGRHDTPTVTFSQRYETASAIATGRRAAQSAVLDGDIRVDGDVVRLLPWRTVISEIDRALATLRTGTTY